MSPVMYHKNKNRWILPLFAVGLLKQTQQTTRLLLLLILKDIEGARAE